MVQEEPPRTLLAKAGPSLVCSNRNQVPALETEGPLKRKVEREKRGRWDKVEITKRRETFALYKTAGKKKRKSINTLKMS